MKLDRPLATIDLETTGTDIAHDRIWEFGVTVLSPDGSRSQWMRRFNPGIPLKPEVIEKCHVTDAELANEPPFSDWAPRIYVALKGKDLAGYNLLAFDLPMLDEELRRCGGKLDLTGVRVIDGLNIWRKKEPRTLSDAVWRFCGREHEGAHGAGQDTAGALDVILGELEAYADLAEMNVDALAEFSRMGDVRYADLARKLYLDEEGDVCYGWGKHKGRKVKLEPGYAEWALSQDFPGSTRDVLEKELDKVYSAREAETDEQEGWRAFAGIDK